MSAYPVRSAKRVLSGRKAGGTLTVALHKLDQGTQTRPVGATFIHLANSDSKKKFVLGDRVKEIEHTVVGENPSLVG